jgi:hypothetical protein
LETPPPLHIGTLKLPPVPTKNRHAKNSSPTPKRSEGQNMKMIAMGTTAKYSMSKK